MAKKIRGNTYYEARLKREHPKIHADLLAGKYASVREACIAAGLKKPGDRVRQLTNLWNKASPSERDRFLQSIGASPMPATATAIVDSRGYLLKETKTRIEFIMTRRGLKIGQVMSEMGFTNNHDTSLGMALSRGRPSRVRADVQRALEGWLNTNRNVR